MRLTTIIEEMERMISNPLTTPSGFGMFVWRNRAAIMDALRAYANRTVQLSVVD